MSTVPESLVLRTVLTPFLSALGQLIELAEQERDWLAHNLDPVPLPLVRQQEALSRDYARLSEAIKPHARALQEGGFLDVAALERQIRHLVFLMKDNQRRLSSRRAITTRRVEAVMRALARNENDLEPKVLRVVGGTTELRCAASRTRS